MNNLYEALEICLQEIEQGADIEAVLFRFPDFAEELRPILETAANARKMSIPAPSAEVVQRNRARVLQHAAEMRESNARASTRRLWIASLRRVAVTLVVIAALFVSGTGLVRAASTTLPGDNLYPVKRTWEDVRVMLTFNVQQRQTLEVEHENERLYELRELFAKGRSASVDFAGVVTSRNGADWSVSNIPVVVSAQTELRDPGIATGSAVHVMGYTQANGAVLAERIELLPPGAELPELKEDPGIEQENHEGPTPQYEDNSGNGSGENSPNIEETPSPESETSAEVDKSGSDSGKDSGSSQDSSQKDGSNSGSSHDGGSDSGGSTSGSGGGGDG